MRIKGKGWGSLAYWQSGEWQLTKERLHDEDEYNPPSNLLFASLRAVHPDACRVAICGQDPYPNRDCCTGIAFDVPRIITKLPPTLVNIFREYQSDLGYPAPKNGDLTSWCNQGVLLWNVYPTCATGRPGSHHWEEWTYLTLEIVEKLDVSGKTVFCFLGGAAAQYAKYVRRSPCIVTSHPSPLGARHGFLGSRIFTRINSYLDHPIDWRLPAGEDDGQS